MAIQGKLFIWRNTSPLSPASLCVSFCFSPAFSVSLLPLALLHPSCSISSPSLSYLSLCLCLSPSLSLSSTPLLHPLLLLPPPPPPLPLSHLPLCLSSLQIQDKFNVFVDIVCIMNHCGWGFFTLGRSTWEPQPITKPLYVSDLLFKTRVSETAQQPPNSAQDHCPVKKTINSLTRFVPQLTFVSVEALVVRGTGYQPFTFGASSPIVKLDVTISDDTSGVQGEPVLWTTQ